jgi:hypothetical protein
MLEESENQWDIQCLKYDGIGLEVVVDPRQETITFRIECPRIGSPRGVVTGSRQSLTIGFESFAVLERDLNAFVENAPDRDLANLKATLQALGQNREVMLTTKWQEMFGHFAFLLLRYDRKYRRGFDTVAETLLCWVGPTGGKTAWRLSYDSSLRYDHRYRLLRGTRHSFATIGHGSTDDMSQAKAMEVRERELFWWSTLRVFELASEWHDNEGHYNLTARSALREASATYLQVLKDEPRRRDLAGFFSECGMDVESEVKRVLFPRDAKKVGSPKRGWGRMFQEITVPSQRLRGGGARSAVTGRTDLIKDEVIRRTFFVWFLRRYDLKSARRLLFFAPPANEKVTIARPLFRSLNFIAALLLLAQLIPVPTPSMFLLVPPNFAHKLVEVVSIKAPWIWGAQVFLQLASLGSVLLLAPSYFRLLMPRALFGSLLAWTTIFLTALPDLTGMKLTTKGLTLEQMWHEAPLGQNLIYSFSIGSGVFLLSFIFIAYTITQFLPSGALLFSRALRTSTGLVLGSCFWSMIFALPIKYILESGYFSAQFVFDCYGMIPIFFIGTPLAVLFGLIIQLIWEDASLTEPLGEPL